LRFFNCGVQGGADPVYGEYFFLIFLINNFLIKF